MSINRTEIGKRLRKFRKEETGLSGVTMAAHVGVSTSYLSEVERGKAAPNAEVLAGLAREFGVDPVWLLTGDGKPLRPGSAEVRTLAGREAASLAAELEMVASCVRQSPGLMGLLAPDQEASTINREERYIRSVVSATLTERDALSLNILRTMISALRDRLRRDHPLLGPAAPTGLGIDKTLSEAVLEATAHERPRSQMTEEERHAQNVAILLADDDESRAQS